MQDGFMPGKGTTDALFTLRRMQEEFRGREKKLYMCFVDLEKAFDRVPRKVMKWALRKKSLPEVLVKAVMSLYEGSRMKVRVGSGFLEEFGVRVGVHQGSVLYMCFVDLEKAFDRVPRKVMKWALRKKSLPEVLVKAVCNEVKQLVKAVNELV